MAGTTDNLIELLDALIPGYLRALRTALADAVGNERLTMQQLRCMQAIAAGDALITTTMLAELMRVSVPTMSSMLDGMIARGLVERKPLPSDRRRVPLVVTEAGKNLLNYYQSIMDDRHRKIVNALSASDREIVLHAAQILLVRLKEINAGAPQVTPGPDDNRPTQINRSTNVRE